MGCFKRCYIFEFSEELVNAKANLFLGAFFYVFCGVFTGNQLFI